MKTYEQTQLEREARRQVQAEANAQRQQELAYFAEVEQQRQAERDAREHENELFMRRVEYAREHGRQVDVSKLPTIDRVFEAKAAEEALEAAVAETARQLALTPAQLKRSTLSYAEQQRRAKWEQLNGTAWPEE